jgi:endonuclease YncB( thermonuclease family)
MGYTMAHPDGAWKWDVLEAVNDGKLDGDTCRLVVDNGFGCRYQFELRLMNCYAPELSQPGGMEAKAALANLLTIRPMVATTYRRESGTEIRSFIRWVGTLTIQPVNGWTDIGTWMVDQGYATLEELP